MRTKTLYSWETRRYPVVVTADADPTADAVEFGVVLVDAADNDPAAWVAGSWNTTYNAATKQTEAYTCTFGTADSVAAPDITLVEGSTYRVYARTRNASDVPGALVAVLAVT